MISKNAMLAPRNQALAVLVLMVFLPLGLCGAAEGSALFRELQTENAALRKRVEDARAQLQQTETQLEEARNSVSAARDRIESLEARVEELERSGERATERADAAEVRAEKAVAALRELRQLLASQGDAIVAQKEQVALVEKEKHTLREEHMEAEKAKQAALAVARDARTARKMAEEKARREEALGFFNLAVLFDRQGRYEEAERYYHRCLDLLPEDASTHFNLGILYDDKLRRPRKAMHHYKRFLELDPESPDAERVRSWLAALDRNS